jgi:polysaccharide biosynthesis transport protein
MEKSSNSLLGKAAQPRRVFNNAGYEPQPAQNQPAENQPAQTRSSHDGAIDLRPRAHESFGSGASSEAWVPLIDPRKLFGAIIAAKRLIAVCGLIGLGIGIIYAASLPKYYYSTAEILIDPRDLQLSDRELLPTGLPYDASLALVENQTRILTSRRVIHGTVEKLNLDQDPEYNGKGLGTPGPVETLKAIIFGQPSDDTSNAKELAVETLLEATSVSRTPKTFVISLVIRSEAPEKAALIANTMAEVYMDVQDEIQSDTVGRANGELGGRLEELRTDVEKAERLVEAYRSENGLFDANGKLISDDEIVLTSTQLTRAREKVAELRARADSARELTLDAVLSDALPEGAASNLIAELRRGYAAKVQQRDALAEKLGAQHPQLRTAEAEVTSAKRGIEAELRRLSQTAQIELQRAVKTEQDLAAGQARLKSQKSTISSSLVRLRELEREAAARRSVYESFLLRARETGQQAGLSTANTTIVSQAVPALRSYGTSRKIIALGGLFAGCAFGIMIAVLGVFWRALTQVEPGIQHSVSSSAPTDKPNPGLFTQSPPAASTATDDDRSLQVKRHVAARPDSSNQNLQPTPDEGDPMYYPYPSPQHGMMNGNGMMIMSVPQQQAPQPMMPQMMQQPMMPQMMQNYPYAQQPMMQQPVMPQMMQHYPYAQQPMMQPQPVMQHYPYAPPPMMQPVIQPVVQPVYVAVPQQPAPLYQATPVYQPQSSPQPSSQPSPQPSQQPSSQHYAAQPSQMDIHDSDYSEIRGRLQALRNGIVNLADGRDRLSRLG